MNQFNGLKNKRRNIVSTFLMSGCKVVGCFWRMSMSSWG